MDGLAQRLSFQTDPVDGQNSVPYMDCPGPAGLAEQRRQKYQILPDSTDRQGGRPVRLPVLWLRQKQSSFLWQKKTRQPLFTVSFIWEKKKVPKGGTANSTNLMKVSLSSQITALTPLRPAIPPLYPLPFSHLSARPFLVRPEITMGSKGSSVPEIVMPSGPLYLFSSTV